VQVALFSVCSQLWGRENRRFNRLFSITSQLCTTCRFGAFCGQEVIIKYAPSWGARRIRRGLVRIALLPRSVPFITGLVNSRRALCPRRKPPAGLAPFFSPRILAYNDGLVKRRISGQGSQGMVQALRPTRGVGGAVGGSFGGDNTNLRFWIDQRAD